MDRHRLDAFSHQHRLPPPAIGAALRLTGLQPDAPAWRAFAATLLRAAGLGAIGAGILFFVAANWQDYGVLGRWALLALPFALAGLSGALWAVWWSVLNVALALLCGWLGPDHFVWRFIAGWG